ncbi:ATP-binding cassette domain-containing protein [Amycolatopsis sp. WQ 127309]|uniref:ATP-binding cassette domain-containing protein n=1 Tax=Amycolatopsis sp. WQ 127309 TaxID=2932773 RepID=UPI001FF3FA9A|nr:ATP-binding cassette domain-containing protein [Amycolatopsis sp. WQ 127309]UOZ03438.1 ATP-binding cassette domain-containing protein [Amycolatopsis sp. WQ 127309]
MFQLNDITLRFGAVQALSSVSVDVRPGEVVGLLGDNGAGKSTLLSVMAGARKPNSGSISIDGHQVEFQGPRDAARKGVQIVYQDLALFDAADIATNIVIGREKRRSGPAGWLGMVDRKAMRRLAQEQIDVLEVSNVGSLGRPVEALSGGQRQAVALARASVRLGVDKARVLLLDEPTAALGYQQSRQVERFIQRVAADKVGVVIVTHDLPLCFEVADRMVVLNRGRKVADVRRREVERDDVVGWITGSRAPQC